MFNGLFTWNWKLWYQVNTLIGATILCIGVFISNNNVFLAGMFYGLIYAVLWGFTLMFENTHG